MDEEWRTYPKNPKYLISSCGRVKGPRGLLRPAAHSMGYPMVTLMNPTGKGKRRITVHILVCETFHSDTHFPGAMALHRNGIKTDNHKDNLYWGTHQQNMKDSVAHGTHASGERVGTSVLTEDVVAKIRAMKASGQGVKAISKALGIKFSTCQDAYYGRYWKGSLNV